MTDVSFPGEFSFPLNFGFLDSVHRIYSNIPPGLLPQPVMEKWLI